MLYSGDIRKINEISMLTFYFWLKNAILACQFDGESFLDAFEHVIFAISHRMSKLSTKRIFSKFVHNFLLRCDNQKIMSSFDSSAQSNIGLHD